jgi:hypothetical protein
MSRIASQYCGAKLIGFGIYIHSLKVTEYFWLALVQGIIPDLDLNPELYERFGPGYRLQNFREVPIRIRNFLKGQIRMRNNSLLNPHHCCEQCCGSMTFWGGSRSGSADSCHLLKDSDPDPAIFITNLQDGSKKLIF